MVEISGTWINDAGNMLVISPARRGRFRARFTRLDDPMPRWRRWLAALLHKPALGLSGSVRNGALEIDIGSGLGNRALRLTIGQDEDGDYLLPELIPGITDLDSEAIGKTFNVRWLEPLTPFRRPNAPKPDWEYRREIGQ